MLARLTLSALLALGLGSAPMSSAFAGPMLRYQAPAECPPAEEVGRSLESRVEPLPGGVDERVVIMEVTADPTTAAYSLTITLEGPDASGERQIAGDDCPALVDAGVVIVAIALGPRPGVLTLEPEPPSGLEESPEAPDEARPDPEPPPAPPRPLAEEGAPQPRPTAEDPIISSTPRRSGRLHLGGWLLARLNVGALPTASAGFSLGLTLRASRLRGELAFQWLPRSVEHLDDTRASGGEFSLLAAEARLCGDVLQRSRIDLSLCGGVEIGAMLAEGVNVDRSTAASAFWIAPEAGALLRIALTRSGRLALRVDAALTVPILRSTFFIEGSGDVHRAAPVSGRFGLGLSVDFF